MRLEGMHLDRLFILTDSQVALQTAINLSRGASPRPGIERELNRLLRREESRTPPSLGYAAI